jgi:DNA-binding transcriptional ArsR family regulator
MLYITKAKKRWNVSMFQSKIILKDRGVLVSEKDGKNRYYSLKHERLTQVIECIDKCAN